MTMEAHKVQHTSNLLFLPLPYCSDAGIRNKKSGVSKVMDSENV
jgi:hypothetical protein